MTDYLTGEVGRKGAWCTMETEVGVLGFIGRQDPQGLYSVVFDIWGDLITREKTK